MGRLNRTYKTATRKQGKETIKSLYELTTNFHKQFVHLNKHFQSGMSACDALTKLINGGVSEKKALKNDSTFWLLWQLQEYFSVKIFINIRPLEKKKKLSQAWIAEEFSRR